MNRKMILTGLAILALLLSGCEKQITEAVVTDTQDDISSAPFPETSAEDNAASTLNASDFFSARDFEVGYDETQSAVIQLNGTSAVCDSDAVQITGSTVTILDEGTYILSGTLEDGRIIVDAEKSDKTQLVLNGVTIHSQTSAPIYVLQSDKVFLTLADGTENTLSNGGSFTAIDDNNIDAVIFSKEDLTLNGSGSLTINSPAGHGIVSKDSLTITSGTYTINAASHALSGKDDISIANASFTLTSGKDGIHAENNDDPALGTVYIQSGDFHITAQGDGISASADMQIEGGSFDLITGGGSENAAQQTSASWGAFSGGGKRGGNGMGNTKAFGDSGSNNRSDAKQTGSTGVPMAGGNMPEVADGSEDSTSLKGIKAGGDLTINGGTFSIDSADDAVHSNANLTVSGGIFDIASGDDGFHADDTLTVYAGSIQIRQSYEGLEALHLNIYGGDITVNASDDGLNAAGGTDASGMGGRGGDKFGGRGGSTVGGSISISGGTVYVQAYGDGVDANGSVDISGGMITVCCPAQGDCPPLDYDTGASITGGTFIGTGSSGMAQSFSDAGQGVISVNAGNCPAGTEINLTDASGKTLLSACPEESFSVILLSSPELIKGQTYILTVGSSSAEFTAN
ncbi:MAG: carbohydrate-binding domain-containing protein [Faecousia sp.]